MCMCYSHTDGAQNATFKEDKHLQRGTTQTIFRRAITITITLYDIISYCMVLLLLLLLFIFVLYYFNVSHIDGEAASGLYHIPAPARRNKQLDTEDNSCADRLSEHQIRGCRAVSAEWLQGKGSHKRNIIFAHTGIITTIVPVCSRTDLGGCLDVRSVFKISCLFLRPRPWQFEIWTIRTHKQHICF